MKVGDQNSTASAAFFTIRLLTTWLTADSTNELDTASLLGQDLGADRSVAGGIVEVDALERGRAGTYVGRTTTAASGNGCSAIWLRSLWACWISGIVRFDWSGEASITRIGSVHPTTVAAGRPCVEPVVADQCGAVRDGCEHGGGLARSLTADQRDRATVDRESGGVHGQGALGLECGRDQLFDHANGVTNTRSEIRV